MTITKVARVDWKKTADVAQAEITALKKQVSQLRQVLDKLEYSSHGDIKRYPTEDEVEVVLRETQP